MTNIERIAEECMGMTARQANLHMHAAMEESRRNILATRRRPGQPIISDRPPEWISRISRYHRQREMVKNGEIEIMYGHGEA